MLEVFLDANVIYSGLLYKGNENTILELGRLGLCELVTNDYVMRELDAVFGKKIPLNREEIRAVESYLNRCVTLVENPTPAAVRFFCRILSDKKDAPVAAGAMESSCDILATGDAELLSAKVVKHVNSMKTKDAISRILGQQR